MSKIARYSHSTSPNDTVELIRTWLDKCQGTHQHSCCKSRTEIKRLPTRLVDVGPKDGSEDPRLLESANLNNKLAYVVALSYRWAKLGNFMLTSKTFPMLSTGVRVEKYPLTFQHAIQLCRRLGYRYLWIDSLCIFQDSPKDQLREINSMKTVYQNCAWTLAAIHGEDCTSGCFSEFDRLRNIPCLLPCKEPLSACTMDFRFINPFREADFQSPLFARGWVFQEAYLSRTVYVGTRGVYWECFSSRTDDLDYQYQADEGATSFLNGKLKFSFDDVLARLSTPAGRSGLSGALQSWYKFVSAYSRTQFSNPMIELLLCLA